MPQPLIHFWSQGDAITHATAIALLALSVSCWYVILGKIAQHLRYKRAELQMVSNFWDAGSPSVAIETIRERDRSGLFADLAEAAHLAARSYRGQESHAHAAGIDASEFIMQSLRQALLEAQARLEGGLTFLASVGATAPFIGLFGTVWGIYHALVGLSGATQVVLEKVAGPVGEALIMTAAGLFVAIPAVLAYNGCVRANRLLLARLQAFAHRLQAYLAGGIRPQFEPRAAQMAPQSAPAVLAGQS